MSFPPPRQPVKKQRQNGRLLPAHWVHPKQWWFGWSYITGCTICGSRRVADVENGKEFCYVHRPIRAEALDAGSDLPGYHSIRKPSKREIERVLKASGRKQGATKPAKPKKRPRDRRYVR